MPVFIVDIIPRQDSFELGQNSEPSIAVNPTNAMQMIVGALLGTRRERPILRVVQWRRHVVKLWRSHARGHDQRMETGRFCGADDDVE